MRNLRFMLLCCLLLADRALLAQATPAPRIAPAQLVPAPRSSPLVHPDGSVTFDLEMPHAEQVQVQVEGFAKPFAMQRDAASAGHWTYTLPPLPPEYYSYSFLVDGTNVVDPHNVVTKPSAYRVQSVFLVQGHALWEQRDVPHGVVSRHEYTSAIVERTSSYYVYTPPGFDAAAKRRYPVLYLLHGFSDEGWAWTDMGKANVILDNLIAEGRAQPMIVVMPLGYGTMEMIQRGWISWTDAELVRRNYTQFAKALATEVEPRVLREYPISPRREDHAIAGLSMGGAETLLVGLNHTEEFAWVGAFSAAGVGGPGFAQSFPAITAASGAKIDASLRLLWISCGTEDGLIDPNRKLVAWLREQGLRPQAVETPGMHVWMVWRDNLAHFLPLLFEPMPVPQPKG